jgi:raffinose/stachyose/melibiose transport system substrate-binding protein
MSIGRRSVLGLPLALATPSVARAATTELRFWSWREEDRAFYDKTIATFRKSHPGAAIRFQPFEPTQYPTILSTALAGGKAGDILQVKAYGGLASLAGPGYLAPLDKTSVPELANFPADALASVSAGGHVYAVPFARQTMLLIYNTELFAKHGAKPPATWGEMLALCKALKAKGVTPFANGTATAWQNETLVFSLLSSMIGKQFAADVAAGHATFADPRFVTPLGHLLDVRDYLSPNFTGIDYATSQQLFVAGRAAMFAGGSYELANFRHQNPDLKLDVFPSPPLAAGDLVLVSVYYDGGYALDAKSAHRDAALAFLRTLGTPAYGTAFSNALQNVSPIKDVTIADPLLEKVRKLDADAIPYLMLVYFRYHEPNGSVLLQSGVQKMLAGQATPQQVAAAIDKGIATYDPAFRK